MSGAHVGLAHCVWLTDREKAVLARTGTHLLHCPSSNLKLASGVAQVPELLAAGVSVSLGADGAPCNNNLDGFMEMRLAALVHKPRVGPRAMPASTVVRLATMGGAAALGLADKIGSLEPGKRADVNVVVDGRALVESRALLTLDEGRAVADGRERAKRLFARL
jgi:cytosine/adenosine deaminase-related metal-dependent hydrolase